MLPEDTARHPAGHGTPRAQRRLRGPQLSGQTSFPKRLSSFVSALWKDPLETSPGLDGPPPRSPPHESCTAIASLGALPGGPRPSPARGEGEGEGKVGGQACEERGREGYRLVGEQWRSPRLPGRAEPGLEPGALAPSAVLAPGFAGWQRRELSPPLSPAAAPSLPGPRQVPSESPAFLRDAHAPPRASAGRPLSRKPLLSSTHLTPRKRLRAGGRHGGARGNQATDDNRQRLPRPSALAPYTMCTLQAHVAARPAAALGLRRESRVTPSPGLQAALSSLCAAAATPASAAGTRTRGWVPAGRPRLSLRQPAFSPSLGHSISPDVPSHRRHSL